MSNIVSLALAQFRETEAAKSHEHMNRWHKLAKIENRSEKQDHEIHIALHKAMLAADNTREAHEMLCGGKDLRFVIESMLPILFTFDAIEAQRDLIVSRANAGYEYFENIIEDKALAKFHYDAYGER